MTASPVTVPATIDQTLRLTRFQLRDYLRSRRFVILYGLVAILGAIISALFAYYRPFDATTPALTYYAGVWGNGFYLIVVLSVVIVGGDAIAGEFQNKTGYFLMGLPLRRAAVYVGKYIAVFLTSLGALLLFFLIIVANGAAYLGAGNAFPVQLWESLFLAIGYLLAVLGATFLFSSMFKTGTYATVLVAILFLFGFSILAGAITFLAKIEPWFVISYAESVVSSVLTVPYPAHVTQTPFGTSYVATLGEGVAIMLGYFVFASVGGLVLFEREEFS